MRLRHAAALLLAPLLFGCGGAREPRLVLTQPGWEVFAAGLRRELAPIARLEQRRRKAGIPLRFRVGEEADLDTSRGSEDTACGPALTAFVRELPPPSPARVGSESVLELGPGGQVLRRWPLPLEMSVADLRGEEIYVPHGVELPGSDRLFVFLAIRPDGTFRVMRPGAVPQRERVECPALAEEVDAGPLARSCWVYRYGPAFRVLSAPGPCL